MMMYIGCDEVVVVVVPRGTHHTAAVHDIDLQELAIKAIVERVRAASLATQMLKASTWNAT